MNQKMKWAYNRWQNSSDTHLYDVYKSCSSAKWRAWEYCENLVKSLGGSKLRIIGASCHFFSVGFEYPSQETGEIMFCYHTASNTYSAPMSEF